MINSACSIGFARMTSAPCVRLRASSTAVVTMTGIRRRNAILLEVLQHRPSIDLRQQQIEDDQPRVNAVVEQIHGLGAVFCGEDRVPCLGQDEEQCGERVPVIFNDENSFSIEHIGCSNLMRWPAPRKAEKLACRDSAVATPWSLIRGDGTDGECTAGACRHGLPVRNGSGDQPFDVWI